MKEYKCGNCEKVFNRKTNYENHINRKISCSGKIVNIKNILLELNSLKEELKLLKQKEPIVDTQKDSIVDTQKESIIDTQKEPIADTQKEPIADTLNNTNINTQNNILNNTKIDALTNNVSVLQFMLNGYGEEDMSHVNDKCIKNILNKGFKSIPQYIESIHFNDDMPTNKNICISNRRDSTVNVYDGKKWILKDKQDFLDGIKEKGIDFIEQKIEDLDENNINDKKILNKINRFLESYKSDSKQMKKIDKDIQLILYNNREMIKIKNK
jgi:hypothetical protein